MTKVMMIGTAEESGGGISSVIRLIKKMPLWERNSFYWLGTQIQSGSVKKFYYALKAALIAPFIIWKYDIVHFHMVPGITLFIQLPELIVAKVFRKKIIMEVHVGNQLLEYSNDKFFKWWFRRADLVLLLAYKWKDLFAEKYSDVKTATDVLYNACEMLPQASFEEKKKQILFAGTIDDNKAPDLLLKAWSKLKNKYPAWKVTFLGSGNIAKFQQMAEELNVADCVEFLGYVVGERKEKIFREASIFCMCSFVEGFPMVVLEAWTHSISVVTTPVGGLPDIIEDGKNCLTFPFGEPDKLASQIEKLIKDDKLIQEIGRCGYECAQNKFSLNNVSEKLEQIYNDLTKK